jgi:hypothetical protein
MRFITSYGSHEAITGLCILLIKENCFVGYRSD